MRAEKRWQIEAHLDKANADGRVCFFVVQRAGSMETALRKAIPRLRKKWAKKGRHARGVWFRAERVQKGQRTPI